MATLSNLACKDKGGWTCLHYHLKNWTGYWGSMTIAEELLEYGSDVTVYGHGNETRIELVLPAPGAHLHRRYKHDDVPDRLNSTAELLMKLLGRMDPTND